MPDHPERANVTLDEAEAYFEETHGIKSAQQLLKTALVYWNDDMISDETFGELVSRITHRLAKES